MNQPDYHPELIVQGYRQGIKLVKSTSHTPNHNSLSTFFNQSFNLYLVNTESAAQQLNECTLITCGMSSNREIFGKSVVDVWGNSEAMRKVIAHDKKVIATGEIQVEEEDVICKEGMSNNSLSIKLPWYNSDNKIIGVLGCTLVIGMPSHISLANFIEYLMKKNLLRSSILPGIQINDRYFSKREKEIIYYLIRGNSAKQIAKVFGTSFRTVEHQIASIKIKLNVKTKNQLIEKVIDNLS